MRFFRAAIAVSLVCGSSAASADAPPFARRGAFVIGSETQLVATSSVPRNEPYYAWREERRNALLLRAVADGFLVDRWSLGAGIFVARERTEALGPKTTFTVAARLGLVFGDRSFAFWPGLSAGVRFQTALTATIGADLRFVVPLTDSILLSIGPRLEFEAGRADRERNAALVLGFSGASRVDGIPRLMGRDHFGHRGMRVFDVQLSTASRAFAGSGWSHSATRVVAGLDGFLGKGVSLGSWAGVASHNAGAARVAAVVAGVRIGRAITFGERVWWWPRVGLEVSRADVGNSGFPRSVLEVNASAPFIVAVAPGVGFGFGPWMAMPLVGSHVRKTSVGIESAMVFWF